MTDIFKDHLNRFNGEYSQMLLSTDELEVLYQAFKARMMEELRLLPPWTEEEEAEWRRNMVMKK